MDEREIERLTQLLDEIKESVRVLQDNFRQAVLNEDVGAMRAFGDDVDDLWFYIYVGEK